MKLQRIVFVLIGMMFLFAGKSLAQQVKTDYDRSTNFGQYKTYSWRSVRCQDQATDLERHFEQHALQQLRQEHQEPG